MTETFGSRVKECRDALGKTQEWLAQEAGISQAAIMKIEAGGNTKYGRKIALALGVDLEYLETGKQRSPVPVDIPASRHGQPPEGYVRLEHLSPCPSMGPGASFSEPVHIVQHLDVLESWVRQKVGSADFDRVKILTGCGQSMLPTIHDQDLVFVDINQRTIDVPGIYVVDVYGRFLLKRALILTDGTLILKSDNIEEFPDEERIDLLKAAETITVAGRVKAWWTLRRG